MRGQSRRLGPHKKLVSERSLPGLLGDHPNRQSINRIGPAVEVLDEQVARLEVLHHTLEQRPKVLRRHRLVHLAPMNQLMGRRVVHNELVLGTAPRARPGHGHQRAVCGQPRLASNQRSFK